MSDEFVLDDDLFSFEAKVQPKPEPESEDLEEKSLVDSEDSGQDVGLGEFDFGKKPTEP